MANSIQRRQFLARAAAAAAAAAANPFARADGAASRAEKKHRVAIIGCGRMGQYFAEVYRVIPETEIVAIAEWNDERRPIVGKRFGVKALYKDVHAMLREVVPDLAVVVTPSKFMKDAVIACARAGVKGVSTDKPLAATLADADAMVDECKKHGTIFAGGNLQRAKWTVQNAAKRLHAGEFGKVVGAAVHRFSGEISGGGCQALSVLRLFANAEVQEVLAWGSPEEAMKGKDDTGLNINGRFRMTSGLEVQVFSEKTPYSGVDIWTDDTLLRWNWDEPQIFRGTDSTGARKEIDPDYPDFQWQDVLTATGFDESLDYLVGTIRSFIRAVEARDESLLWISGHDLRQALEIAIASKRSAQLGNLPVNLPLADRSLTLFPRPYRWLGGDETGRPQDAKDAAGKKKA